MTYPWSSGIIRYKIGAVSATREVNMGNTVNVSIAASDNGTIDKVTAKAKNLNKELTKSQVAASNLGKPAAGTVAYNKAKAQTDEMFEYRQARGGRGTGAEGRDFAKQAQGLGGLVHVYATFAANLFAVSAAFTALSKAADYTNMVKGLDQLGAASGRNLGFTAKSLIQVTDNAISMKEAIEAVAQTNAAGMTSDQIMRMGGVAKNASLALGRDLGDALNRLSRGITKIEPELLDELGIFVRVDKAAQQYARTVGKTADSLSEFERRQAFANAVLEQGEEKFGSISLAANQYNKLLANFTNIMYSVGGVINKVLEPLVGMLASSQVALGALILGITSALLNTAIPALKGWRDNIRASAKEAEELAKKKVDIASAARKERLDSLKFEKESIADQKQLALEETQNALLKAQKGKKLAKDAQEVLKKNTFEMTSADLALLDSRAQKAEEANKKIASTYREVARRAREAIAAEKEYSEQVAKNKIESDRKLGRTSVEGMNLNEAQKLQRASARSSIVSSAVDTFSARGWTAAWGEFDSQMKQIAKDMKDSTGANITQLDKFRMKAYTVFGMGISYVSKFINAFGFIGAAVAAAYGVFEVLNAIFSKNEKQVLAFSEAIDQSSSSVETLNSTLELISKKDPFARLSPESIQATANALNGLSVSIQNVVNKLAKADAAAVPFDRFVDSIKDLFGIGLRDRAEKSISDGITNIIKNTVSGADKQAFEKEISNLLNIDTLNTKNISEALENIPQEKIIDTFDKIAKAQKRYTDSIGKGAAPLSAYSESVKSAEKSMQGLMNSFIPTDNMSKFGMDQMVAASRLAEAMKSPKEAISALAEAATDFDAAKIFPPEATKQLSQYRDQLVKLRNDLGSYEEALKSTEEAMRISEEKNSKWAYNGAGETELISGKESQEYKLLEGQHEMLSEQRKKQMEEAGIIQEKFARVSMILYNDGAKKVYAALETAMANGANAIKQSLASEVGGPEGVKIRTKLQLESIGIQQKAIDTQLALILETKRLSIQMEIANAHENINRAGGIDPTGTNTETIRKLTEVSKALTGTPLQVLKNIRSGTDEVKVSLGTTQAQLVGGQAQKAGLSSQASIVKDKGAIETQKAEKQRIIDKKQEFIEETKQKYESLKSQYTSLTLYDEEIERKLESYRIGIQNAEVEKDNLEWLKKKEALEYVIAQSGKDSALGAAAAADLKVESLAREAKLVTQNAKLAQDSSKAYEESLNRRVAVEKELIDWKLKELELESTFVDIYEKAGYYNSAEVVLAKLGIELSKRKLEQEKELLDIKKQIDVAEKAGNTEVVKLIKEKLQKQEEFNEALNKQVKLQAEYEYELQKTGQAMKIMEKGIFKEGDSYIKEFSNNLADKVGALYKISRSAGEAFADGIIDSMDTIADTYGQMLKEGTFNIKELGKVLKKTLQDAAIDAIMQGAKNDILRIMKDILPKTEADKKAEELAALAQERYKDETLDRKSMVSNLTNIAAHTKKMSEKEGPNPYSDPPKLVDTKTFDSSKTDTKGYGTFGSGNAGNEYANSEGFESLDHTSANEGFYDDYTTKQGESATSMLSASQTMSLVANKQEDTANMQAMAFKGLSGALSLLPGHFGQFGQFIALFGSYIIKMIMTPSTSGGSSGGGTNWMGLISAGFQAYSGNYAGAALSLASTASTYGTNVNSEQTRMLNAQDSAFYKNKLGGAYQESPSLSAYSNSIVSSPTLFAFAKGTAPKIGLMGEAGEEAIIPLKRGPDGNLGVRSTSNEPKNNITINVSAPGGDPAEVRRSTAAASRALLATLNGSRRYG